MLRREIRHLQQGCRAEDVMSRGTAPGVIRQCGEIGDGLQALEKQSVKQLGSDASHLYYLLLSKGLITRNEHTRKLAKEHSEISKLRFDEESISIPYPQMVMHVEKNS